MRVREAVVGVLDRVLPPALGTPFRWLFGSTTVTNLGDGILVSAGPLLVASLTKDPLLVALAMFAQRLPWLLFGLLAGALVDRQDRVRLVVLADSLRVLVVGALVAMLATGTESLPALYLIFFLLGTAETVADNAGSALVPQVVPRQQLGRANSRLMASAMITNQLAGPPLGSLLFVVAGWLAFGANAVLCALGVVLVARIARLPKQPEHVDEDAPEEAPASVWAQAREGVSWLVHHPPMRTLTLMIAFFNITFGMSFGLYVLYAEQRLGLGEVGFGLLMATSAAGGVLGASLFGRLERRFDYAVLLRAGLVLETASHAALALTRSPWVAGIIMFLFGVHATVWGTTSTTVRQRAVPTRLQGRVTSAYLLGSLGGIAVGTLLGGVVGRQWGVLSVFWTAFALNLVILALLWGSMRNVASSAD